MSKYSYTEIKYSNVESIGTVPKSWGIQKIKYAVKTKITDGPHETPDILDEGIPFLSAESVKKGKLDFNLKRGFISIEDHIRFSKKCKPQYNDIFMIKSGATTGEVAIVETDQEFSIWSPLALIRANSSKVDPRFMYYYISSRAFREQVELGWNYGTQQNIGMGVIGNLFMTIPSLDEQKFIVKYLEGKILKLDKLIEDKKVLIQLLEEKRQSMITEAVTKGLYPNVKMKDSGVVWIGEIPEHWEMKKIKYLIKDKLTYGANESAELDDPELPRYIRITDIDEKGNLKDETFKSLSLDIAKEYPVIKNDILLARSGATVGKAYHHSSDCVATFAGYLIRLRTHPNYNSKYIYYFTQSSLYQAWIQSILIQATIQNVSAEKYANLAIPISPKEEMEQIVRYIEGKEVEIRTLIDFYHIQIQKLKEYRQSLIYEAVTGKIDVREFEVVS